MGRFSQIHQQGWLGAAAGDQVLWRNAEAPQLASEAQVGLLTYK